MSSIVVFYYCENLLCKKNPDYFKLPICARRIWIRRLFIFSSQEGAAIHAINLKRVSLSFPLTNVVGPGIWSQQLAAKLQHAAETVKPNHIFVMCMCFLSYM